MMTKIQKTVLSLVAMITMMLPMVQVANAQFTIDDTSAKYLGVSTTNRATSLVDTIFSVIRGLLGIVFVIAVLMFVIGGLFYLTSAGSDRTDQARDIITYAIIGLVVSVLGYAVVVFLSKALVGKDTGGI